MYYMTSASGVTLIENIEGVEGLWISSPEIGRLLEVANPTKYISNLFNRNSDYFKEGEDWVLLKLRSTSGIQETRVFSEIGFVKLMRFSRAKLADAVMDKVIKFFFEAREEEVNELKDEVEILKLKTQKETALEKTKTHPEEISLVLSQATDGLELKRVAIENLKLELEVSEILSVPKHLAETEAVKSTEKETGVDFSHLIKFSTAQKDIPEEEEYLQPTDIAKKYGFTSGMKVNERLKEIGYQEKVYKEWRPTKKGAPYAIRCHSKNGSWTGYNFRWNTKHLEEVWGL